MNFLVIKNKYNIILRRYQLICNYSDFKKSKILLKKYSCVFINFT